MPHDKSDEDDKSHPSWVCGLKQPTNGKKGNGDKVTPFVGVWIETYTADKALGSEKSHPSWVCGLKLSKHVISMVSCGSHPSWVCGLKPYPRCIQTIRQGHTLRGCVD